MELTVNYGLLIIWLVGSLWQRPKRPQPSSLVFRGGKKAALGWLAWVEVYARASHGRAACEALCCLAKRRYKKKRERVECTVL